MPIKAICPICMGINDFNIRNVEYDEHGAFLKWEDDIKRISVPIIKTYIGKSIKRPLTKEVIRDYLKPHDFYKCTFCGNIFPLEKGLSDFNEINRDLIRAKDELTDPR